MKLVVFMILAMISIVSGQRFSESFIKGKIPTKNIDLFAYIGDTATFTCETNDYGFYYHPLTREKLTNPTKDLFTYVGDTGTFTCETNNYELYYHPLTREKLTNPTLLAINSNYVITNLQPSHTGFYICINKSHALILTLTVLYERIYPEIEGHARPQIHETCTTLKS